MKITPLEIRQKAFEKVFRGYDKDEVNAFLLTLSKEWERMQDEYKELRMRLEASEKEVAKLREVESSLFKTLKTADDTATNMVEQASKAAELHMKETQMRAEALLNEAKNKARAIIEKAEDHSRQIIEDMKDEVKALEQSYIMLENHRDNLINELRASSSDLMDKLGKLEKKGGSRTFEEQLKKAKGMQRNKEDFFNESDTTLNTNVEMKKITIPGADKAKAKEQPKKEIPVGKPTAAEPKKVIRVAGEEYNLEEVSAAGTGSFFDELN